MRIVPMPCLSDNYAYLVVCERTGEAAVVDASEAEPVLEAVKREGVELVAIWSTHHHLDHVGGNEELVAWEGSSRSSGTCPTGGGCRRKRASSRPATSWRSGSVRARVTHIPGHTLGAVAYFVDEGGPARASSRGTRSSSPGAGGSSRGRPRRCTRRSPSLAALPDDTRSICGHEYTEANLRFAHHVEPSNEAIREAAKEGTRTREQGRPSVPGTVAREKATNPFLRPRSAEIRRTLGISPDADDVTAFAAIRKAKNEFRA